ncbi:MAG: ABC transporter permease [Alphaproteobacteria bacterium]|nr:ABC transporter permease [Alphaproteobacteria bacterium]
MSYIEAVRSALDALRANVLRSLLTMLGIIIGVASVVAMVAVGTGARERVMEQIRSLGSNLIIIVSGSVTSGGVRMGSGSRQTLSQDDAVALEREIGAVQLAIPVVRGTAQIVAAGLNWSTTVHGTSDTFLEARDWTLSGGRNFTPEEMSGAAKVALIGETVAINLFPEGGAVGQEIRIKNVPFTVIGQLARKGQNMAGQDQDDTILIPLMTAKRRVLGTSQANARAVGSMLVKIRDGEDMKEAEEQIRGLLRQRHRLQANQDDDFWMRNLTEVAATRDASSRTLAFLLAAVATVSLLVGGIGIMNIMLVSVTERTREIGLRLAVGARPRDILAQFLVEATTLATIGGAVGVVIGAVGAHAAAAVAGWATLIQPESVALAVGFSFAVGVFFGFYPAQRASRLDPIEALRTE